MPDRDAINRASRVGKMAQSVATGHMTRKLKCRPSGCSQVRETTDGPAQIAAPSRPEGYNIEPASAPCALFNDLHATGADNPPATTTQLWSDHASRRDGARLRWSRICHKVSPDHRPMISKALDPADRGLFILG